MAETPDNLLRQTTALLLPLMTTVDEREAWLTQAFYTTDRRLFYQIEREGSPLVFTTRCVRTLLDFGCLTDSQHALAVLLDAVKLGVGRDALVEVDALITILNPDCAKPQPPPVSPPPMPPGTPAQPTQTIATPADRRSSTVFISYSHTDAAVARQLIADLQASGHACWIDTTDIKGGDEWIRTIAEGINNSYAFITLVSEAANKSRWVRREYLWAEDKRKLIYPVMVEACGLPIYMIDLQAIPLYIDYASGVQRLLSALPSPAIPQEAPTEALIEQATSLLRDSARSPQADDLLRQLEQPDIRIRQQVEQADLVTQIGSVLGDVHVHQDAPPELAAVLADLRDLLRKQAGEAAETLAVAVPRRVNCRAYELDYLDRLRLEELLNTEKYTPMAGTAQVGERRPHVDLGPVVIRPEFEHLRRLTEERLLPQEHETRRFEDIIAAIHDLRRAVLLGEPGAGKTTTLWKLARSMVDQALKDREAAIPLLVRLGRWTDPDQPLQAFIAGELGGLGACLEDLLAQQRAALLLDGLNEIPVAQRGHKDRQVQALFEQYPDLVAVVTCRAQDYTLDLGFDRIAITPLDPVRIREFVQRYLGDERGEGLFWRLAGEEAQDYLRRFQTEFAASLPDWERIFWQENTLPEGMAWGYGNLTWSDWLGLRDHASSMMALARNPYMLYMITDVFNRSDDLPANRGELFASFVQTLLDREEIAAETGPLLDGLAAVAYEMQVQRSEAENDSEDGSALTVLPREAVRRLLSERLLYLAGSASLLEVGEQVRFTHQLLQEYFAALYMQREIAAGRLRAADIWPPERWWERTNWEVAATLLAGLYSDDCTRVLDWAAQANPEVAARCALESGAHTPPETLARLRTAWLPRLTDLKRDPQPEARAAVGRALGLLDLDNRPGVGCLAGGEGLLPDIAWCAVPGGVITLELGEPDGIRERLQRLFRGQPHFTVEPFEIARYPVTYAQYAAFVNDDGYSSRAYWTEAGWAAKRDRREPDLWGDATRHIANHPVVGVSWYEALAFCAWLSARLGYEVRLPTEWEWQQAATGGDPANVYPWGRNYRSGYANINETTGNVGPHNLRLTSAVGIYPQGASTVGALDMSGNVWEWCLNEYGNPERTGVAGDARRVLRGGSWFDSRDPARAVSRYSFHPTPRYFFVGFRVVRPPSL